MVGQQNHIVGLDLIRFAAVFGVMMAHYELSYGFPTTIGVQVFFTLSGFVIAFSAERASAAAFAKSRALRLLPTAWICATISLAFLAVHGADSLWIKYANSLILAPKGPWVDGVYWTLPVEIIFYCLVFLVLATKGRVKLSHVLNGLAVASAAFWVLTNYSQFRPASDIAALFAKGLAVMTAASLDMIVQFGSFFALGGWIYISFRKGASPSNVLPVIFSAMICCVQVAWAFADGHPLTNWPMPIFVWLTSLAMILISVWKNGGIAPKLEKVRPAIRLLGLATYPPIPASRNGPDGT